MVFKDINSVVDNCYYATDGPSTRSFGLLPVGYKARLIAVAYRHDELLTCAMDMTIAENQHTLIKWTPTTEAQMHQLFKLDGL